MDFEVPEGKGRGSETRSYALSGGLAVWIAKVAWRPPALWVCYHLPLYLLFLPLLPLPGDLRHVNGMSL